MTAPSPAAAGLPAEDVERVARALHDADDDAGMCDYPWPCARAHGYRRLAAAALAAMQPTADAAAARVQAAANQRAAEAERREADTIADIVLALADDFLSEFDAGKEVEVDGAYEWLVQQAAAIRAARPKYPCYCLPGPARCDDPYNWCDRAAALASPAPGPQAGER